jgi:hypothetical protein
MKNFPIACFRDNHSMAGQRLLLAQSIFPRLNCTQYRISSEYRDEVNRLVESASVGGFVLFDGDIETVYGVVGELRGLSGNTLLFAADCEDGVTMRFAGGDRVSEYDGTRSRQ